MVYQTLKMTHARTDRDSRVLVDKGDIRLVEKGTQVLLGHSQAHGVGDTLAEGTCHGDMHSAAYTGHSSLQSMHTVHMWVIQHAGSGTHDAKSTHREHAFSLYPERLATHSSVPLKRAVQALKHSSKPFNLPVVTSTP